VHMHYLMHLQVHHRMKPTPATERFSPT